MKQLLLLALLVLFTACGHDGPAYTEIPAPMMPGHGDTLDVVMFGGLTQSNDAGAAPRRETPDRYYATDPRVLGFDLHRDTLATFTLGRIVNDTVRGDLSHSYNEAIVPPYGGVGPITGFVYRWKQNNAGNKRRLLAFAKDQTPPLSSNAATTVEWYNRLMGEWKTETAAMIRLVKQQGFAGMRITKYSGLGEGNGLAEGAGGIPNGTGRYYADMVDLLNQQNAWLRSFETDSFKIRIVGDGIVLKQQAAFQQNIAPLQRKLAASYPKAFLVELPGVDPINSFMDQPYGRVHYDNPTILRLGEYEADLWQKANP